MYMYRLYFLAAFGVLMWFILNPILNPEIFPTYIVTMPNLSAAQELNELSERNFLNIAFVLAPLAAFMLAINLIAASGSGDGGAIETVGYNLLASVIFIVGVIVSVSHVHNTLFWFPTFTFVLVSGILAIAIIIATQVVAALAGSIAMKLL